VLKAQSIQTLHLALTVTVVCWALLEVVLLVIMVARKWAIMVSLVLLWVLSLARKQKTMPKERMDTTVVITAAITVASMVVRVNGDCRVV